MAGLTPTTRLAAASAVVLLALLAQAAMAQPPSLYAPILRRHNRLRSFHYTSTAETPALKWSATVASTATAYASRCIWEHDPDNDYGENLYVTWGGGVTQGSALTAAVNAWYAEASNYDYANPRFSYATGHFTQVVWVGSSQLGCAVQTCPTVTYLSGASNAQLVVCRYSPPGNYIGEFRKNVLPRPTAAAAGRVVAADKPPPIGKTYTTPEGAKAVVLPALPPKPSNL